MVLVIFRNYIPPPETHSITLHPVDDDDVYYIINKFDEKRNTFVEPYLPNYKIGIMHLAAGIWKDNKDMRLDKSVNIEIKTLENKTLYKSLRYSK